MFKKCACCGRAFETKDGRKKLCKECTEYKRERKPRVKPALSVKEVMHIASVYDVVNGTKIIRDYGKISNIINSANVDTCVCCGEPIPEGRMVCYACEDKYYNHQHGGKK